MDQLPNCLCVCLSFARYISIPVAPGDRAAILRVGNLRRFCQNKHELVSLRASCSAGCLRRGSSCGGCPKLVIRVPNGGRSGISGLQLAPTAAMSCFPEEGGLTLTLCSDLDKQTRRKLTKLFPVVMQWKAVVVADFGVGVFGFEVTGRGFEVSSQMLMDGD